VLFELVDAAFDGVTQPVHLRVGQHDVRPGPWPGGAGPDDMELGRRGDELGAVVALSGGHHHSHQLASLFAGQMRLVVHPPRERPSP